MPENFFRRVTVASTVRKSNALDRHLGQAIEAGKQMPIVPIKGLGTNIEAAMSKIRQAKFSVARVVSSADRLEATATDIAEQFEKHHENLLREATSQGNSDGQSMQDASDALRKVANE